MSIAPIIFRGGPGSEENLITIEEEIEKRLPEDYRQWILAHEGTCLNLEIALPALNDGVWITDLIPAKDLTLHRKGTQGGRVPNFILQIASGPGGEVGMKITEPDFGAIYASSWDYYDMHIGEWLDDPDFLAHDYTAADPDEGPTLWASERIADNFTDWITDHGTREFIQVDSITELEEYYENNPA